MDEQLKLKIKALNNYLCIFYDITLNQLHIKSRKAKYATVRFWCYNYLKEYTKLSLSKIGELYNRDGPTVNSGLKRLKDLLDVDKNLIKDKEKFDIDIKKIFDSVINTANHLTVMQNRSAHHRSGLNR